MNVKKYIPLLKQQIKKARYVFSLGAIIIKDGEIVGAGYNRVYSARGESKTTDHAEILALKKTPRSLRDRSDIIVMRIKKNGQIGMAKPCSKCEKALRKAGINRVYYSNANGSWSYMRLV